MLNKNEKIIVIVALVVILIVALLAGNSKQFGSAGAGGEGTPTFIADPVNDQVVSATPAILQKIIVGGGSLGITDDSAITISDSITNTVGSIIYTATGSNLAAVQDIFFDAYMKTGITITTTAINNVTVMSSPR